MSPKPSTPAAEPRRSVKRDEKTTPQLSCTSCSARKVRCDKGNPCSRCCENGTLCVPVYRQRLPRGRHVRPPTNKLSADIKRSPSQETIEPFDGQNPTTTTGASASIADLTSSYDARLQTPLNVGVPNPSPESTVTTDYHDAAFRKTIWRIYTERVAALVRVFHSPSLFDFLASGKPYTGYKIGDNAHELVFAAVVLCCIASLQDDQCLKVLGKQKTASLHRYRLACESALDRLGLYSTEDLTVLQCFIAYILALRSYDRSRTPWTLVAVAVRLATDLKINNDDYFPAESFFQQQMRRRLWYQICLLDMHFSLDRFSDPLISADSVHPRLPINIDDADFGPLFASHTVPRSCLTDISLVLFLFHAQAVGKVLAFKKTATFEMRQYLFRNFETHVRRLQEQCEGQTSAVAWRARNGSLGALAMMQLHLQQPQSEPRDLEPSDARNTSLLLACKCLNHDKVMRCDPNGEPFRWWRVFQWHPLGVALNKVCSCHDAALLRVIWPIIEENFEQARRILAPNKHPLWIKLEDQMLRAYPHVNVILGCTASIMLADGVSTSVPSPYPVPQYPGIGDMSMLLAGDENGAISCAEFFTPQQADAQQYFDTLPTFTQPSYDAWQDTFDVYPLVATDDLVAQLLADSAGSGYS